MWIWGVLRGKTWNLLDFDKTFFVLITFESYPNEECRHCWVPVKLVPRHNGVASVGRPVEDEVVWLKWFGKNTHYLPKSLSIEIYISCEKDHMTWTPDGKCNELEARIRVMTNHKIRFLHFWSVKLVLTKDVNQNFELLLLTPWTHPCVLSVSYGFICKDREHKWNLSI